MRCGSPRIKDWQAGTTGIALIDAGMRELWATGYMRNRVRMVVGSFLTKNLGIHWRQGEEWFWDTLVDADAASNPFNWQWGPVAAMMPRLSSASSPPKRRPSASTLRAGTCAAGHPRCPPRPSWT